MGKPFRPPTACSFPGWTRRHDSDVARGLRAPTLAGTNLRAILPVMSTAEIMDALTKLSPAQREVVRTRLDALDEAEPLSPDERRIVEERLAAYRQRPEDIDAWTVAEADIRKQLGLTTAPPKIDDEPIAELAGTAADAG